MDQETGDLFSATVEEVTCKIFPHIMKDVLFLGDDCTVIYGRGATVGRVGNMHALL
jgi:hypothetical protein